MSDVVLVHIGTVFPPYLNDSIEQLLKFDFNIHLIISKNVANKIKLVNNIVISYVEDYINDQYLAYQKLNSMIQFRDGFWQSTSARFIIMKEYVKKNNLVSFFHIEYDNLVFSDLNKEREILENTEYDMCIVMDSETRALPSIIWIRYFEILEDLVDLILAKPLLADMYFLAEFFFANEKVTNFPMIPDTFNVIKNLFGQTASGRINYSNMFNLFQSVFDGITIGQYLGGIDPRNVPTDTVGHINELTMFNPSNFQFEFIDKILYLIHENHKIRVNNIHVHGKNLRQFM